MDLTNATDKEISIAKIKADIFTAVISNGSLKQKDQAIETAKNVFEWVFCHVAKPNAEKIEPPAPKTVKSKSG